ncbi:MAG: hypothetical protein AAF065_03425 [Verrucomicrobiota bacterium]
MSKTFQWTIPEPSLSEAEHKDHKRYKPASKGIHFNTSRPLTKSECKFFEKWTEERAIGRKAFNRRVFLRTCLGISVLTGFVLLLKVLGIFATDEPIYTSALIIAIASNLASSLPSWKRNEKRYADLAVRKKELEQ